MNDRELLRRRQQLLDRFLAGEIDQATYDRMLKEIERLSGAEPPLARPVAPAQPGAPARPVAPSKPVAPMRPAAPAGPNAPRATSPPQSRPAASPRPMAAPVVLAPTVSAPSATRGHVGVAMAIIGGVLAVLVVLAGAGVWLGNKLLTKEANVVAAGPQRPQPLVVEQAAQQPAAPPSGGAADSGSTASGSRDTASASQAGWPARPRPPGSLFAVGAAVEGLKYRWEPGKSYTYSVKIEAEQDNFIDVLSGNATYSVKAAPARRPSRPKLDPEAFKGTGTAFVISPDGYLLSCCHVVEGMTKVEVAVGGTSYEATVLGTDEQHDLALLRVTARGLPALPLGDSDRVQVGEEVRAIGFPLASILGDSVKATRGTVSGIESREGERVLQIDAGINPGNSGGPLVNQYGEVIGVNFAKLVEGIGSGVGFAAPINYAKDLLGQHGVKFTTARSREKLDGPELIRRVSPAVALVTVRPDFARLAESPTVTLTCTGSLMPSRQPKPGQPVDVRTLIGLHRFGMSALGNPLGPLAAPVEIEVDELGRVVRASGQKSLPWVLGELSMLVIEPLPGDKRRTWATASSCTIVLEDSADSPGPGDIPFRPPIGPRGRPFGRGPGTPGFGPGALAGRGGDSRQTTLLAREHVSYSVDEAADDVAKIRKRYVLRTQDQSGGAPRLQMEGDGQITFDVKAGVPHAMQFEATLSETTGNKTERLPIKLTYKLLTPEELERLKEAAQQAAAERAAAAQPKPLTEQALKEILVELEHTKAARRGAAEKLATAQPNERREEVAKLLEPLLADPDQFTRASGARALGVWGTKDSVPALVKMLDDPSHAVRWPVLEALGKLKDEQAAEPLAECVRKNKDRHQAAAALKTIGPVAEKAVIGMLADGDMWVRHAAAEILKEIGTNESIEPLKKVLEGKRGLDTMAAEAAIKAIALRVEEK